MNTPSKPCRNCGGTEFYSREVGARGSHGPNLLPIGFWSFPKFRLRICGGCGLVDWFVPEEFLAKVKEKFSRE